jgi:hypothetical protein
LYQGIQTAFEDCSADPTSPTCGTQYANYIGGQFGNFVYIEQATTEVTHQGGVALAIVPDSGTYNPIDRMPYFDTNVPCMNTPHVQWAFGRFSLAGELTMRGWVPSEPSEPVGTHTPTSPQGTRMC